MGDVRLFIKAPGFDRPDDRALKLVRPFLEGRNAKSGTADGFWEYLSGEHRFYCTDRSGRRRVGTESAETGVSFARRILGRATTERICRRERVLDEDRWVLV